MSKEAVRRLADALRGHGHITASILAAKAAPLGLRLDVEDALEWYPGLLHPFGQAAGAWHVPALLGGVIAQLTRDGACQTILDPWAGVGGLLGAALAAHRTAAGHAITRMPDEAALGKVLLPTCTWSLGDALQLIPTLGIAPDLIVCIPPMGMRSGQAMEVRGADGKALTLAPELGEAILLKAVEHMAADGMALFVMPASFLLRANSVRHRLAELGWGLEAAFELPAGSFLPYSGVLTTLVVVRKCRVDRLFVGQLSNDAASTAAVIANYLAQRDGGSVEMGCYVEANSFRSIGALRAARELDELAKRYGTSHDTLGELAMQVNLGRSTPNFTFPQVENAIYLPLVGSSDVHDQPDKLTLKPQHYAQVVLDPLRCRAAYLANFLNTEEGRAARTALQSGVVIPRLNKATLSEVVVFVPDLTVQDALLEFEGRLLAEHNVILGLQTELAEIRRTAWTDPLHLAAPHEKLNAVTQRLSVGLRDHTAKSIEDWYETLPFPLASILRAWQASPPQDHRTKHDHLQHFFEATAEFLSVVLLSAFSSNPQFFEAHKQRLQSGLAKQHLSFERATFGTWKTVIDYLGKQLRQLLHEGGKKAKQAKEDKELCAALFADHTLHLARILSKEELAAVVARTNKYRNDWKGHGGVLGNDEAAARNELLMTELQRLREALEDLWARTEVIRGYQGAFRRGQFENEIAILKGSNSEFLKETRVLGTPLDVERLYIWTEGNMTALKLLPLVHIGASPPSARNACYFFNRLERSGVRFVSYHYADLPELTAAFEEAKATIQFLTTTE
jgi:hypothetical protein